MECDSFSVIHRTNLCIFTWSWSADVNTSACQMETGQRLGIRTTALLVRMDNVLGQAVGNTLEIAEAIACLQGRGPQTIVEVVCTIGTVRRRRPSTFYQDRKRLRM